MKCRPLLTTPGAKASRLGRPKSRGIASRSNHLPISQVPVLPSSDPEVFHNRAFSPALPCRLPWSKASLPRACSKWFIHDENDGRKGGKGDDSRDDQVNIPRSSELRASFWSQYRETIVPLELTSKGPSLAAGREIAETFHRTEAPLEILLTYLTNAAADDQPSHQNRREHSIYLAQCSLSSLPPSLQGDLPVPALIARAGPVRGDIYASSLWLGRPPTYTPLHRDPNPNIFTQLAGEKVVRLLPPEIGAAVFADVQAQICDAAGPLPSPSASTMQSSAAIRGDEMMSGPEKTALHAAVWPDDESYSVDDQSPVISSTISSSASRYREILATYGRETTLRLGDTLFIPKGWWHSVKGVGAGVTASANWWFR